MNLMQCLILGSWLDDLLRFVSTSHQGPWVLIGAMLLIMMIVGGAAYWIQSLSRHRHHHHRHHSRHHADDSDRSEDDTEDGADGAGHKRRRRRRRREHRPRNPTLAETGGLPPIRREPPRPAP
jgi:hypothetical protein